jgi:hypothetical protein
LLSNLSDDDLSVYFWLKANPDRRRRGELRRNFAGPVRHRQPGARQQQEAALRPGSTAAVISAIERCGTELSRERAARWARQLFTPAEVQAWLSAGLSTEDLELAIELRSVGVPPEALNWVVRKESMLDRIRLRSCPPSEVAQILRREGLLPHRLAEQNLNPRSRRPSESSANAL